MKKLISIVLFLFYHCAYGLSLTPHSAANSSAAVNNAHDIATVTCSVNNLTGSLSMIPLSYGHGYTTAPSVTFTPPSGATANITANPPVNGQITGYSVTSPSGWISDSGNLCPATFTVSAPPATTKPISVLDRASGMTSVPPTIRADDFGCKGNGVADDRVCLQNAVNYAASAGNGVLALTTGKTYYVGSIGGTYAGAGDDGTVPVAAVASCTAASGVVTGCTITSRGYRLTRDYLTLASGVTGSGATFSPHPLPCSITKGCPDNSGNYIASVAASGGTGYPDSFKLYIGNTCSGVPCATLAPEAQTQIGYGVQLPAGVTIEGNGATVSGGFFGAAAGAASYSNSFPYIATFAGNQHNSIRNLTFSNVFIGVGNSGSYLVMDSDNITGGILAQGNNVQYSSVSNLNVKCQCTSFGGVFFGGQWVSRAPQTGPSSAYVLNGYDLADNFTSRNDNFYLSNVLSYQKPFDCWFDSNFFHLEDQGATNGLACYNPPSGIVRVTDQDMLVIGQNTGYDSMWRGVYGSGIVLASRYGRPINNVIIGNIVVKSGLNYAINLSGPDVNATISSVSTEQTGYCSNGAVYGSSTCPNPYEPWETAGIPGVILMNSSGNPASVSLITPSYPVQAAVTNDWYFTVARDRLHLSHSPGQISNSIAGNWHPNSTQSASASVSNMPEAVFSGSNNEVQADSLRMTWQGLRYYAGIGFRASIWSAQSMDGTVPSTGPSVLEFLASGDNLGFSSGQSAYVKAPGLLVGPSRMNDSWGQVRTITITNGGSGYTPYGYVACSLGASTGADYIPGTTTPPVATCIAQANGSGVLSQANVVYPAYGYIANPAVTFANPASGTTATATATIAPKVRQLSIGDDYIYPFYLSAGGSVPPYSTTTLSGAMCGGYITPGPANQSAQVLMPGGQFGAGLFATVSLPVYNSCVITLHNPTGAALSYPGGAGNLWEIEVKDAGNGLMPPSWVPTEAFSVSTVTHRFSVSLTPATVTASSCAEQIFPVSGLESGTAVSVSPPAALGAHIWIGSARASAAGTLAVDFCGDATSGTPPSGTYQVSAW